MRLDSRGPHVDHTAFGGSCRFTCRTGRSTVISKKDGNCKMAATRRRTCLAKLGMPKNVPSTMTRFGRRSRPCPCNAARKGNDLLKCAHRSARHCSLHRPSLLADMPVQCGVLLCSHDGHGISRPCRVPAPAAAWLRGQVVGQEAALEPAAKS